MKSVHMVSEALEMSESMPKRRYRVRRKKEHGWKPEEKEVDRGMHIASPPGGPIRACLRHSSTQSYNAHIPLTITWDSTVFPPLDYNWRTLLLMSSFASCPILIAIPIPVGERLHRVEGSPHHPVILHKLCVLPFNSILTTQR